MQLRSLPAAVALLSSLPFYSMVATATEPDAVIVTATRTAQTVDASLASVTVITRDEIEQLQAQSLQDLLRGIAGLSIANNGGAGKATSIFMRGTESDHVLVLIDGVKVGSATSGSAAFQDIPVAQIDHIEIVRGPRSSLYGAEAIGGVIQIFTRKGQGEFKPTLSVGAGSYGTHTAQAGVFGGDKSRWFSGNVNLLDTDGFNAKRNGEADDDGYRNLSASLNGGVRSTTGVVLEFNALRGEGESDFDGTPYGNESKSVQQVLGTTLRLSPLQAWQMSLAAGQSRDQSDSLQDSAFQSRFNTRRDSATWQNDITVGDDRLLTVGIDRLVDRVETSEYDVNSRGNTGVFTQYQGAVSVVDLQAALRRDDNEQFKNHSTGSLALGTDLGKNLRGTLSYGTAFKAPSFNELYYPFYGTATLKPEESRTVEIGIAGKTARSHWNINAYETNVDNLIAYDSSTFSANNLDSARIRGVDAICGVDMSGWAINANLSLLDPENRTSGANYGKTLARRAKTSYRLDADRSIADYQVGASLRAEGHRYDNLANTKRLGGFATVDLRAGYDITKAWQLQARIENLLDKEYETAQFYNQPGRSGYVTLRYQP